MDRNKGLVRLVSAMLAAVFFCISGVQVRAAEVTEPTGTDPTCQTSAAAQLPSVTEEAPAVTETAPVTAPTAPAAEQAPLLPETLPEATLPEPETVPTTEATEPVTVPTTEVTEPVTVPATEATAVETLPVTEVTLPAQIPTEETAAVETLPAETRLPDLVGTADIRQMDVGESCRLQGTLVWISGTRGVLQDSAGGIRVEFFEHTGGRPGEVMEVTAERTAEGLYATDYTFLGSATLPERECSLADAPETERLCIRNALVTEGTLTQGGQSVTLDAALPQSAWGSHADVWGVLLDGVFHADNVVPVEAQARTAGIQSGWNFYFGLLHAHTEISDGYGTVEEAFAYAADVEGLDFFAVTDHSDSFDNALAGEIGKDGTAVSQEWAAGQAAAEAVSDGDFLGLFGYEMTWPEITKTGHINTFNTPGWQTRDQAGFETPEGYYRALAQVPEAVSMFNHPSHAYGNFSYFSGYTPEADRVMHLLEVGSEGGMVAYDLYTTALDRGWHLAPANNQNNHNGGWGDRTDQRTVILAKELTKEALFDAIRHYRVYATEDKDLLIHYQINNQIMGSVLPPTDSLILRAEAVDPTDEELGTVEVIADGGTVVAEREAVGNRLDMTLELSPGYSYYYLRITQADGDVAVTAPVWIDSYTDIGIGSFTCQAEKAWAGENVPLSLTVVNRENVPFSVESIRAYVGQTLVWESENGAEVPAVGERDFSMDFCWEEPGRVRVRAVVTGWVEGMRREYEATLAVDLARKPPQQTQPTELPVLEIGQVRAGVPGTLYRVQGYVTAGTSNPYNTFPNTLYLQDDSGGIAVTGWYREGVQVGTPLTVTGILVEQGGCPVLELVEESSPGGTYYRYAPKTTGNALAMDYAARGGQLLQVEGTVTAITRTADGYGISRFTVKDIRGDLATVIIEDNIRSGAYGTNELAAKIKKGRTVRAMGLLHLDTLGEPVLRVRNCDEVVYVPPKADPTNPRTADPFGDWRYFLQPWSSFWER